MNLVVLLAQLDALNPLGPMPPVSKTAGLVFRDLLLLGGAVLVLSVILVFWARRYVHRSKRRHRHEHHSHPLPTIPDHSGSRRHHRHRHRHRRHHRPTDPTEAPAKNPTLAETGGLPPLRPEPGPNPPA